MARTQILVHRWFPEQRFRLCLADFTNRSFIACVTQARRRLVVECHIQVTAANINTIPNTLDASHPSPEP